MMGLSMRGVVVALAVVMQPAVLSAASLDQFLATFGACKASESFSEYAHRLGTHFSNFCCEPGPAETNEKISIAPPQDLAAVIGRPMATNHGDHTEVILPISGAYADIPVTGVFFSFGNENGIFAARLQFDAPRATVQDRFGEAIRAADAAGSAAWDTEDFGYSAQIPEGKLGAIVCDWSG